MVISICPRIEFLLGAVKLYLSITSQLCHLNIKLLLRENAKDGKFCNDEVVGFDSAFEGVFQNLISLVLSNWNKEKQFLH